MPHVCRSGPPERHRPAPGGPGINTNGRHASETGAQRETRRAHSLLDRAGYGQRLARGCSDSSMRSDKGSWAASGRACAAQARRMRRLDRVGRARPGCLADDPGRRRKLAACERRRRAPVLLDLPRNRQRHHRIDQNGRYGLAAARARLGRQRRTALAARERRRRIRRGMARPWRPGSRSRGA